MHQQQVAEVLELSNSIIRAHSSLRAFFAKNTDTNVSFLDHRHIIGSVPNSQSASQWFVSFHSLYHSSLLGGRDTATNQSLALESKLHEYRFDGVFSIIQRVGQCVTVNYKSKLLALIALLDLSQGFLEFSFGGLGIHHDRFSFRYIIEEGQHVGACEKSAGETNVDSCFLLVSSEHPNIHVGFSQVSNGIWDTILQLVFNSCGTDEDEFLLDQLGDFFHLVLSVFDACIGFVKLLIPGGVFLWVQVAVSAAESSQTICSKSMKVLREGVQILLSLAEPCADDAVSSFAVQSNAAIW
mmetsp:Transcript_16366/g.22691  ORF Transcript_16366/g.22691 Transcript_16366/m.22691 type:complete len:297 (+) Transcript_16366:387-1277(+)